MENFPSLSQCLILHFSAAIRTTPSAESFATMILGWILSNGPRRWAPYEEIPRRLSEFLLQSRVVDG